MGVICCTFPSSSNISGNTCEAAGRPVKLSADPDHSTSHLIVTQMQSARRDLTEPNLQHSAQQLLYKIMAIFYATDWFFRYSNHLEIVPRLDPYFIYFQSEYAYSEIVKQLPVPFSQPKKTILLVMLSGLNGNCVAV